MEKLFDINEQGYSIRCKLITKDNDKNKRTFSHVAIVTHGYGSNKDTAGTSKFGQHLTSKYKDYAVIAFDWPCHGADARKKLTIAECLTYLTLVVNYAKESLQADKLYIYSTSFGGYITLRYLIEVGNPFTKIALRCPAIEMHRTIRENIDDADLNKLKKGKDIQVGFARKMKIDQSFLDDLDAFKITNYEYFDFADDMLIIHGTKDIMVPIADSKQFAENNVIQFIPVEGANHPFQDPNHMALAIHKIVEFFRP